MNVLIFLCRRITLVHLKRLFCIFVVNYHFIYSTKYSQYFFVKIVRYNNHNIVMWRINVSSHISETLLVKLLTHGGLSWSWSHSGWINNGKMHSIQHYVSKFVSDLRQDSGFRHDITEILLKVTLNTITLTPDIWSWIHWRTNWMAWKYIHLLIILNAFYI